MDSIANAIAQCDPVDIEGKWHRHVPARYIDEALDGIIALSRWGRTGGFPILHLGKPVDSVVVEAYRHLVDPVDDPAITAQIAPRRLVTCDIAVSNILDLRSGVGRLAAGISVATLTSETTDREAYEHCRRVASIAHQLGLHGIVAPAATGIGETLVLFTENLPADEAPARVGDEIWDRLPPDPRVATNPVPLRVVEDQDE